MENRKFSTSLICCFYSLERLFFLSRIFSNTFFLAYFAYDKKMEKLPTFNQNLWKTLVMNHFLRHGTTGLIYPRTGGFFSFNARPDEEGQATSSLESLFTVQLDRTAKYALQAILIPSFTRFQKSRKQQANEV